MVLCQVIAAQLQGSDRIRFPLAQSALPPRGKLGPQCLEMNNAKQGSFVALFTALSLGSFSAPAPCSSPWKVAIWCKYVITPERLLGAENKETNGKLRPAKEEKRICCYSKHMHLVKGWIAGILRIFSMQRRLLFKGSSENSDRLNCMVLNRPGQSFLKFGCPDKKREIIFKQAKINPVFLDEVVFVNIKNSNFYIPNSALISHDKKCC